MNSNMNNSKVLFAKYLFKRQNKIYSPITQNFVATHQLSASPFVAAFAIPIPIVC